MADKYYLAKLDKMKQREELANEFYNAILDYNEMPYIVTDDACLYDFFVGIDKELIEKVCQKYGVKMKNEHFKVPFWQFLDWLQKNRSME